jgi:hypothetical protein
MRLVLLALFASTCTAQHSPPPIGPEPRPAHTADAASPPTDLCVAWCVRLHELNCPSWAPSCVPDCKNVDAKLAALHSAPLDHACGIAAKDCAAERACGGKAAP